MLRCEGGERVRNGRVTSVRTEGVRVRGIQIRNVRVGDGVRDQYSWFKQEIINALCAVQPPVTRSDVRSGKRISAQLKSNKDTHRCIVCYNTKFPSWLRTASVFSQARSDWRCSAIIACMSKQTSTVSRDSRRYIQATYRRRIKFDCVAHSRSQAFLSIYFTLKNDQFQALKPGQVDLMLPSKVSFSLYIYLICYSRVMCLQIYFNGPSMFSIFERWTHNFARRKSNPTYYLIQYLPIIVHLLRLYVLFGEITHFQDSH